MKSEQVTQSWEFYRDNCQGYKESMRQEFRRLDEHVSNIESENDKLRELVAEMFKEHQRIYHTGGVLKTGLSATNRQMARWYGECMRWGIEVDS